MSKQYGWNESDYDSALNEQKKQIEQLQAERDAAIKKIAEQAIQIGKLKDENEKKDKALRYAQRLMEWAESQCHTNCSGGYVPMMPHGDPEPCEWCITKSLIVQALKIF